MDAQEANQPSAEYLEHLLAREKELQEYLADPNHQHLEDEVRGGILSPSTICLLVIVLLGLVGLAAHRVLFPLLSVEEIDYVVFLVILGIIVAPLAGGLVYTWFRDWQCHHIQDCPDPVKAYRRFFLALQYKRYRKAYAALLPGARIAAEVTAINFQTVSLAGIAEPYANLQEFKRYWKWLLQSRLGNLHRTAKLRRARLLDAFQERFVRVDGEIKFSITKQSGAAAFGLIGALFDMLSRRSEIRGFPKLLLRCRNRWWFMEGELKGPLDALPLPEDPDPEALRLKALDLED